MALIRWVALAAVASGWLVADAQVAADRPPVLVVPPPAAPSMPLGARACLIGTVSCLDLAPAPFELCLLGNERCNPRAKFELLVEKYGPPPTSEPQPRGLPAP